MLVFGIISLLPARAFFMLKFYILISSPIGFFRHFSPHYSNLKPEQVEVVINTLEKNNERDIIELCERYGVFYHITESNGTPAKGKNELLEIFQNSNNDYCVQIDGDDYLTPHGVWLFEKIASGSSVPDVICLKNQISLTREGKMFSEDYKKEYRKFFTVEEDVDYEKLRENMVKNYISESKADKYVNYHKQYYSVQQKFVEDQEIHSRVVFMSKKAAQYRFPEELVVGEDTIFYYLLKDAHFRGELVAVCNDEAPATYIYHQVDGGGTVWNHSKGFTDWTWMGKYNTFVENMSDILHEQDLPQLKIHYKDNYVLDDLSSAGLVRYDTGSVYVELPANATKKSIYEHLSTSGKPSEK